MLSIGKVGGGDGNPRYYIDNVAHGKEDYYSGRGEAQGVWLGTAAERDGLDGAVEDDAFLTLLSTETERQRKVLAYDLTFSAPKSVSVLFGLGDRTVAPVVRDVHDQAVADALGYIERNAVWTRRGQGGHRVLRGEGVKVAAFRHRSSRAGDPQLHTHAVVANETAAEGRATTLDGRALYAHAKTAGYLYEASLRRGLTEVLGVEWEPVRKGIAEICGVDDRVLEHFSRRRAEILERLAETGGRSRRAAEIAALDTRRAKNHNIDGPTLRDQWRARAVEIGYGSEDVTALLDRHRPRATRPPDLEATAHDLAGPGGLTEQASTFDRRDVLRAWAEAHRDGADAERLEALTDRWLASAHAVRLEDDNGRRQLGGARYSTPEMLALEHRLITDAAARQRTDVAQISPEAATAHLERRPRLSGEQAAMAARLTTSGNGIEVVRSAAGTGKTHALAAAREIWEADGIRVFGVALAARAAVELESTAGIDSTTIAGFLDDVEHARGLPHGSVLVVDEAGMVGSRAIDRLARHAADTHSKLVLVGDDHQLPEIDAGGAFRGLADSLGAIELREVHRQNQQWDRDALAQLRDGDVRAFTYRDHGRLVARPTAHELRLTLVDDWWESARTGHHDAVMIAHRRSDVADLNALARARMDRDGRLGPEQVSSGDRAFAVGDEVIARRNDRRAGLVNGTRARVTAIDTDRRTVEITTLAGDRRQVDSNYLDEGWLQHGYALTAHAAQGATLDRTFILGSDELYREWGYTAFSRHRDQARYYTVSPGSVERALPGLEPDHDHLTETITEALTTSRSKDMALNVAVEAGVARTVHALDQTREAVEGAERRIAALRGERDAMSRLHRARRAEVEQAISQQQAAIERWTANAERAADSPPAVRGVIDLVEIPCSIDRADLLDPQPRLIATIGQRPATLADRDRWTEAAVRLIGDPDALAVAIPEQPEPDIDFDRGF
ncbi:MAG: conjugative relaxase [Conexibacter sp.]|nr:conjugative relaxase [Conexibacter sp.]